MWYYWLIQLAGLLLIVYLDRKHQLLRDTPSDSTSATSPRPYSYSKTQLAWWTWIISSACLAIVIQSKGSFPELSPNVLLLLGISAATTGTSAIITQSEINAMRNALNENPGLITMKRHQDEKGESFLLDILSDKNGMSITRYQAALFQVMVGGWMIYTINSNLCTSTPANNIIPDVSGRLLLLMSISAATYAGLRSQENK